MLLCFAAVVTLIILNISCAVRYFREKDGILLRQAMKGMKLGSIPFFIINFLVCLMIAAVIFGASRGFAVFLPWVWNWVLCAVASTYIIMALVTESHWHVYCARMVPFPESRCQFTLFCS